MAKGKSWKLSEGRYAYITPTGKRGIASSKAAAASKAGKSYRKTYKGGKHKKSSGGRVAKRKMTIPLALVGGFMAGLVGPRGNSPAEYAMKGKWDSAAKAVVSNYTGYNVNKGAWKPMNMRHGVLPLIIGALVHKFVGGAPLNLNRALGQAGVPFIRI